jgi:hypothetical protein
MHLTSEQADFIFKQRQQVAQIEEHMRQCPAFCLMEIMRTDRALKRVPRQFWENRAFCLEAVRIDSDSFDWVPESVMSEEFFLEVVMAEGRHLSHVPDKYKNEKIFLAAVRQNGLAIRCVPTMRLTSEIVREAIKQNPRALYMVDEAWREGY